MDLRGVRHHPGGLRVEHGSEFDILADQALQHSLGIPGYGVQIERPRPDDLFAAKGEQLAGESGRMIPRLLDLRGVRLQGRVGSQLLRQQAGVPVNDGKQVIEIVRHASRKPPDALQFLSLPELFLQLLLLGGGAPDFREVMDHIRQGGYSARSRR